MLFAEQLFHQNSEISIVVANMHLSDFTHRRRRGKCSPKI